MEKYSPFQKDIERVVAEDLVLLKSVPEGWYVEYKRALPKPEVIAKAVSAFANTYGGWLIIGVEEFSKTEAWAGEICGIAEEDVDGALSRIRQSISSHVNPIPNFTVKAVASTPNSVLPEGRTVICVKVDEGPSPPYLHSKGVIYRRVGDSSEGKAEIDRHELDMLYARRDKTEKRYEKWCNNKDAFEAFGADVPYVRLLIDTNRYRRRPEKLDFGARELKELFSSQAGGSIPIQSVYTTGLGWVARQTESAASLDSPAFTWIIKGGWREVWWPLSCHQADELSGVARTLSGRPAADAFISELGRHHFKTFRVIDLSDAMKLFSGIAQTCASLDRLMGLDDPMHLRVELANIRGCVPFFGAQSIIEGHKMTGLPVQLVANVHLPETRGSDGFIPSAAHLTEDAPGKILANALHMFDLFATGFGYNLFDAGASSGATAVGLVHELLGLQERPDTRVSDGN